MPDVKDSVGDGGTNNSHDVALVQAMLKVIKNAKGKAYLGSNYDGIYGKDTKDAIAAFQVDHGLAAKAAVAGPAPPPGKVGLAKPAPGKVPAKGEKLGLVSKSSATLKKIVASLPANLKNLRILENTKTVYLEAPTGTGTAAHTAITGVADLESGFRGKVAAMVKQVHSTHKIALWLTKTGGRRNFAAQANLTKTFAGPGESNHNFGRAVDIGFKDFQWLQGDGTLRKDAYWLNALEKAKPADARRLWDARDALAAKAGVFPLKFERIHVQAWKHKTVSSGRSLAALLNQVGKTGWTVVGGSPNRYKSNLGLGGKTSFDVGSAKQIWAGNATVTKAMIAKARNEATTAMLAKKGAAALKLFKPVKDADVKGSEIAAIKKTLKADFEAADKQWLKWKGLP